jgi:hypothetical protein
MGRLLRLLRIVSFTTIRVDVVTDVAARAFSGLTAFCRNSHFGNHADRGALMQFL